MCGIVALFDPGGAVSPETLRESTRCLIHRGPDAQRQWRAPDAQAGLGHARLAIIGLGNGHQPLANEDGKVQVVVNGEFYDFERLRRGLEQDGHRFRTDSDSEILPHLYERQGFDCVHALRGEFAFVLWDERRRLAFAARDRFGIKPLYYACHEGALLLASEVKALFAAGVPGRWDNEGVYQALHFALPPGRTLYAGVRQVPPGHYLVFSGRRVRLGRYWDLNYPTRAEAPPVPSEGECIESFRQALEEAVRLRLRADVPVGCYLSGGLDSSAVLGLAARHVVRPIRAFVLSFRERAYDEEEIARETAAHVGAEVTVLPVGEAELSEHFERAIWHTETFVFNTNGVAKYLLSGLVHEHGYRVVLTGEGADEVLAGYPHFLRDHLLHGGQGEPEERVRALLDELQAANPAFRGLGLDETAGNLGAGARRRLGYLPSMWESNLPVATALRGLFTPTFAESFGRADPYARFLDEADVAGQLRGRDVLNQSLYLWSKTWLPQYILSYLGDRAEMAHAVEGRLPFLDHRLFERVRDMPVSLKVRGLTDKYLLREAARPYLTERVYARRKFAFAAPPALWRPGAPLYEQLQEALNAPGGRWLPFFGRDRVRALLEEMAGATGGRRAQLDAALTAVASLYLLQRVFGL
jgi:asparagine synthase (glutamine-hydrolysing)